MQLPKVLQVCKIRGVANSASIQVIIAFQTILTVSMKVNIKFFDGDTK